LELRGGSKGMRPHELCPLSATRLAQRGWRNAVGATQLAIEPSQQTGSFKDEGYSKNTSKLCITSIGGILCINIQITTLAPKP